MVGPCLDLGCNCVAKIFENVDSMRAKETVVEVENGNDRIDIVY